MSARSIEELVRRRLEVERPWSAPTRRDVEQEVAGAGVPVVYAREILYAWRETEAWQRVSRFLEDRGRRVLLLVGPPGTGKSLAACAAVVAGRPGRYTLAAQVAQAYRQADYRARVDRWVEATVLAMDELGREPTDFGQCSRATIWEVVERRWADDRKTILASNLSADVLRERYDEAIWDRLIGDRGLAIITGDSMRRRTEPTSQEADRVA